MRKDLTKEGLAKVLAPLSGYIGGIDHDELRVNLITMFDYKPAQGSLFVSWDERFIDQKMLKAVAKWAQVPLDSVRIYTRMDTAALTIQDPIPPRDLNDPIPGGFEVEVSMSGDEPEHHLTARDCSWADAIRAYPVHSGRTHGAPDWIGSGSTPTRLVSPNGVLAVHYDWAPDAPNRVRIHLSS